jgi:transcriptional regulator with XRE-family HTH domain
MYPTPVGTESTDSRQKRNSHAGLTTADPVAYAELTRDLSDRDVAEMTGLSPTTVGRIRLGLPVQRRVLRRLADALDQRRRSPSMAALLGRAE